MLAFLYCCYGVTGDLSVTPHPVHLQAPRRDRGPCKEMAGVVYLSLGKGFSPDTLPSTICTLKVVLSVQKDFSLLVCFSAAKINIMTKSNPGRTGLCHLTA